MLTRKIFNPSNPESTKHDKYQTRQCKELFAAAQNTNPLELDNIFDSWIGIARNSNDDQLMSMVSVLEAYWPSRIHEGYFKNGVERCLQAMLNIVKEREAAARKSNDSTPKTASSKTNSQSKCTSKCPPEKKKDEVIPSSSQYDNVSLEFPSFNDSDFPSTDGSIFDKMLKDTKNEKEAE